MRGPLLLLCLLTAPAWAQEWSKTVLQVLPGSGVGSVKLGQPIPAATLQFLGEPVSSQKADNTPGSGTMLWGQGESRSPKQGMLVKLGDGKKPDVVHSIVLRGIRATTDRGVYIGANEAMVRKRYPNAQMDVNPLTRLRQWVIPGLTMQFDKDKLVEMDVEPTEVTRWRFTPLKVVAGVSAGPILVGKAIPKDAYEQLGPPTLEQKPKSEPNSGLVRWSTAGQNPTRFIDVVLGDGVSPFVVTSIRLRGVTAATSDHQVRLGDSQTLVKETYGQGRPGLHELAGAETWRIPGLTFVLQRSHLVEMQLYPVLKHRED